MQHLVPCWEAKVQRQLLLWVSPANYGHLFITMSVIVLVVVLRHKHIDRFRIRTPSNNNKPRTLGLPHGLLYWYFWLGSDVFYPWLSNAFSRPSALTNSSHSIRLLAGSSSHKNTVLKVPLKISKSANLCRFWMSQRTVRTGKRRACYRYHRTL